MKKILLFLFIQPFLQVMAEYKPLLEKDKIWETVFVMGSVSDPDEGVDWTRDFFDVKLGGDTAINGKTYFFVYQSVFPVALIREDVETQCVYVIPKEPYSDDFYKDELLFYKFNVLVGEKLNIYNNMFLYDDEELLTEYIVDNVEYENDRKIIYLKSDGKYTLPNTMEKWIEGVGSTAGLIYRSTTENMKYVSWGRFDLLCVFSESNGLLYKTAVADDLCRGVLHGETIEPRETCGCVPTIINDNRKGINHQLHKEVVNG